MSFVTKNPPFRLQQQDSLKSRQKYSLRSLIIDLSNSSSEIVIVLFIILIIFGILLAVFSLRQFLHFMFQQAPVDFMSRIDKCDKINPYTYGFQRQPEEACEGIYKGSFVLCLLSPVEDLRQRETIRNLISTWIMPVTVVFFVGKPDRSRKSHQGLFQLIPMEAKISNDIVQQSFLDTPDTNNLKTMAVLKWLSESCSWSSSFVVVTSANRVLDGDFERRLRMFSGELDSASQIYPHFMVGPLHGNGYDPEELDLDSSAYCSPYPRLSHRGWSVCYDTDLRAFPLATSNILYEAAQISGMTMRPDCDVTGLAAAMAGIPFLRMWAFWPYLQKGEKFDQTIHTIED